MADLTEALLRASRAVSELADPLAVLDTLLDCVYMLVPTPSATVLVLASGQATVVAHRGWGEVGDPTGLSFPISGKPHLERVAQGECVLLEDTWEAPGWSRVERSSHTRAWLGVPLAVDSTVYGIYSLDATEVGFFAPTDVAKVQALAAHGAVVMQTARLSKSCGPRAVKPNKPVAPSPSSWPPRAMSSGPRSMPSWATAR